MFECFWQFLQRFLQFLNVSYKHWNVSFNVWMFLTVFATFLTSFERFLQALERFFQCLNVSDSFRNVSYHFWMFLTVLRRFRKIDRKILTIGFQYWQEEWNSLRNSPSVKLAFLYKINKFFWSIKYLQHFNPDRVLMP